MGIKIKNNAATTLATAVSSTSTSATVALGTGDLFPSLSASDYFYATLTSPGGVVEIVKVTARTGDAMSFVRAQEGTLAVSFPTGSRFELRVTAQNNIDLVGAAAVDAIGVVLGSSSFVQTGTGAVNRVWLDKARDAVSALDFIPTTYHAAILAGTSTQPVASYINAALTAHKAVYFPAGRYYIGQGEQVRPVSGNRLYGPGTLVKFSTLTARTDNLVVCEAVSDIVFAGLTLSKLTGNHFAVHVKGACSDISIHSCRVIRLISFVEQGAKNIKVLSNDFILNPDAQGAIATGGVVDPVTGIGGRGTGVVDGVVFNDNYISGCTFEAIDVNWNTINVSINNNYFDGCGSIDGNEVIDFGGAGLTGASISSVGTGYVTGDVVTMDGGITSLSLKATFTVTAVAGAVTGLTLTDGGYYLAYPTNASGWATTATTTAVTGSGTGLAIAPTYGYCGHCKITNNIFAMLDGVEKRAIRIKWNTIDVHISGNTVERPSLPGSESVTSSDFLSVEQSNNIRVISNTVRNMQQGVSVSGPSSGVLISGNKFYNIRRNALSTGSYVSAVDVDGLEFINNDIEMPNILTNDEAIDISYAKNYKISGGSIRLPTGITEDHIEVRTTSTGRGEISNLYLYGGRYGIITSSGVGPLAIDNVRVESTGREAIYLAGTNDVSIVNCVLTDNARDASVYAVTLDNCSNILLMGNSIITQLRGVRILTAGERHRYIGNYIDCAAPFLNLNLLTNPVTEGTLVQGATTGMAIVNTDVSYTLTPFVSAPLQLHTGTLTAARTIALSTTNAVVGARFRITRTGAGAFNLNVGTGPLVALVTNSWCEVTYSGSAWVLSAYGTLP